MVAEERQEACGSVAGWWQKRGRRQAGVWQDGSAEERQEAGGSVAGWWQKRGRRQAGVGKTDGHESSVCGGGGGGGDPGKFSERDKSAHQTLFSVKIRLEGRVNRVANARRGGQNGCRKLLK
jgi:hypothetical protein